MHGVVFLGERELELRDFPDPRPGPGDVVLAMKASGMCGSDLHPYRASRSGGAAKSLGLGGAGGPCIAGHEPCGVVVERGPGVPEADAPTGARVMNHHYKGCGHCKHCRAGWAQLCPRGIVVYGMTGHGGHAPFMTVPASTLVPLPDELSFEEGAAISCGTGTAYQALRRLDVSGRDTLAVFGQGPVGLSATMLGVAMGARVVAVDVSGPRRELGRQFGADAVVDPGATDVVAALKALTDGEGVDAALDCSGQPDARLAAVAGHAHVGADRLRRRRQPGDLRRQPGPPAASADAPRLVDLQHADPGGVRPLHRAAPACRSTRLLTHRFRLAEAADAYRLFDTQTTGKGVFLFD